MNRISRIIDGGNAYLSKDRNPRRERHGSHSILRMLRDSGHADHHKNLWDEKKEDDVAVIPELSDDDESNNSDTEHSSESVDHRHISAPFHVIPVFSYREVQESSSVYLAWIQQILSRAEDTPACFRPRVLPESAVQEAHIRAADIIQSAERDAEAIREEARREARLILQEAECIRAEANRTRRLQEEAWQRIGDREDAHRDIAGVWDQYVENVAGQQRRKEIDQTEEAHRLSARAAVLDQREAALDTREAPTLRDIAEKLEKTQKAMEDNNSSHSLRHKLFVGAIAAIVIPIIVTIWQQTVAYVQRTTSDILKKDKQSEIRPANERKP